MASEQGFRKIVAEIGWSRRVRGIGYEEHFRTVSFQGKVLADLVTKDAQGRVLLLELYRTVDGRLVVYRRMFKPGPEGYPSWARRTLEEITPADLNTGGKYDELGQALTTSLFDVRDAKKNHLSTKS